MASVTVKNVSTAPVYIRDLSDTLEVGESVTFSRSLGELTAMNALNAFLADSTLQLISMVTTDQEAFWATGGTPLATKAAMTFFVATTGDDLNNGLTVDEPLRTISMALKKVPFLVRAGHPIRIKVAAGTYDERVTAPALNLDDNITVEGADMVATAPAQGLASGTFDAAFGVQTFTNRALVTGAGWSVGGLRGGFFIEILDGAIAGSLFPVINNTATTLDVAFPCNTGTNNLQSRQFRFVKASTILSPLTATDTVAITARCFGSGTPNSNTLASTSYLSFSKMEIRRASGAVMSVRAANGACVRFNNCAFPDFAGGGGLMMTATFGAILRLDDCLTYRGAANNTSFISVTGSYFVGNRHGSYGGNTPLSVIQSTLSLTNAFFVGSDGGLTLFGVVSTVVSAFASDACTSGVVITSGSVVQLSNCVIKNSTAYGIGLGINTATYANATFTDGFVTLFSVTVDNCVRGIVMGDGCGMALLSTGASTISNNTAFGIDAAPSLKSGHNTINSVSTLVMTGNGADFTLDGTTGLSLTALRALNPKRSVEAAATFNRVVET